MASFRQKIFSEYPIPQNLSIWGGDGEEVIPVCDFDLLLESCVDELSSDVLVTAYIEASGMVVQMPPDTITVTSAMLSASFPFQGNRLVKVTYNKANNVAYLRYFPAVITYQRRLKFEDLEILTGDRLIYFKSYVLWKMSERELSILKTTNMQIDNGSIDLTVLSDFRDKMHKRYEDLKDVILLYATVN